MNATSLKRLAFALLALGAGSVQAAVVINEFVADDSGTDDREFVELYNNGSTPVDISGWVVAGRDATTNNPSATIPGALGSGTTTIAPGAYYVLGNAGVLNLNQSVPINFIENDNETIELWAGAFNTSTRVDAVAVETNKGATFFAPSPPGAAEIGPGVFGNHQTTDLAGTPLNGTVSIGRFVDGRDSNNNGRDFGLRPSTPGRTNAPGGTMTAFPLADATPSSNGTPIANMVGSFVTPKVVDPTVVDTNNPNAIVASSPGAKAYTSWDPAGGGNGATSLAVFDTTQASFSLYAYFETANLPANSNPAGTGRGAELTMYGLGSGDAFTNLTDISNTGILAPLALPAAESANGFTGLAWVYERVAEATAGAGDVTEMLYLVDANDGGDSDTGGNTALDWLVLASFDLSSTPSGWHELGISVSPTGNITAKFGANIVNSSTSTTFNGAAFNVGYREFLTIGGDGTPDAFLRPATFSSIPEPSAYLFGAVASVIAGLVAVRRRK